MILLPVLAGCGAGDPDFGNEREGAVPPVIVESEAGRLITSVDPRYDIQFDDGVPTSGAHLLFLERRAATSLSNGARGWTDPEGARAFLFDEDGVIADVLQGAPRDGLPSTTPWWVVAQEGGVHTIEADGRELRFVGGSAERWVSPSLPGPRVASHGGRSVAVRSVMNFDLRPLDRNTALLWVSEEGEEPLPVGEPLTAGQSFLGPLANTGWAAIDDRGIIFASAVEPMLRHYRFDGSLEWEARWATDAPFSEPRFRAVGGAAEPDFSVVQYGVALGPLGHIFVLVAAAPGAGPNTLLVFARTGELLARGEVPEGRAVLADAEGRLHLADPASVLTRTPESVRPPFTPFDIEPLTGDGRLRLADLEGRVVVVNFWASWCAPCRREIPALNEMAKEMDPADVFVVGLNEDLQPADGLRFLEELGGVDYPSGAGRGDLRDVYGYRGLPFTVILDREGRVVRTLYGFGDDLDAIRAAVEQELGRASTASVEPDADER